MTPEEVVKWFFGALLTGVTIVVGWLIRTVLTQDKSQAMLEREVKRVETELTKKADDLSKKQITVEDVRKVIDEALDKRDKQVVERRLDYDKMHKMEIREVVSEELAKLAPRIVREIKGNTSLHDRITPRSRPTGPDDQDDGS